MAVSLKVKQNSTVQSSNYTTNWVVIILPKGNENMYLHMDLYMNVHGGIIHSSPTLKTSELSSIKARIDKLLYVHPGEYC